MIVIGWTSIKRGDAYFVIWSIDAKVGWMLIMVNKKIIILSYYLKRS